MTEVWVSMETIQVPSLRDAYGNLKDLAASIAVDGLRRPVTAWQDKTLLSGIRRYRACMMLTRDRIPVVFVNTIEDAAKALAADAADDFLARPRTWVEMLRLWELLRTLDEPAAAARKHAARQRGVELRRQAQQGHRQPGRAGQSDDYVLATLAPIFGVSSTTAKRLWTIHMMTKPGDPRRAAARQALADIDAGTATIWASYQDLIHKRPATITAAPPSAPVPATKQLAAWSQSLPMLEGLVSGLVELGAPSDELTWDQVGPVHTRLSVVRRELEKMIKQLKTKGTAQS